MRFLYNLVSSLAISLGDHFFEMVELSVPLFSVVLKLASCAFLVVYCNQYLKFGSNLKVTVVVTLLSSILSYLRIQIRNTKLRSQIEANKNLQEYYLFTPISYLLVLTLGIVSLNYYDFEYPRIYTLYYLVVCLLSGYLITDARLKSKAKLDFSKARPIFSIAVLDALLGLSNVLIFDSALYSILFMEAYQICLLYNYHIKTKHLESGRTVLGRPKIFFGVLATIKTSLMYIEYLTYADPVAFVFGFAADNLAFWILGLIATIKSGTKKSRNIGIPRSQTIQ